MKGFDFCKTVFGFILATLFVCSCSNSGSSLKDLTGTWECSFYDFGALNKMYLTINEDGTGHVKWNVSQRYNSSTIMDEAVKVEREDNRLKISVLRNSPDEAPEYFNIENGAIYTPNGEKMTRD